MYKISVIIPTYNCKSTISRTFDSLLNQTFGFENLEVILIDDESTDATQEVLTEFSKKYENVKTVFLKENTGSPSIPRNIGIQEASADYIMFLDNDDIYYPKNCEIMYNTIKKYDVDVVISKVDIFNRGKIYKPNNHLFKSDFMRFNSVYDSPELIYSFTAVWDKIYKKKVIINNNIKFPEGLLEEDMYFSTKYFLNSKGIILLNNFYGYCWNYIDDANENLARNSTSANRDSAIFIKKLDGWLKVRQLLEEADLSQDSLSIRLPYILKQFLSYDLDNKEIDYFLYNMNFYFKKYSIINKNPLVPLHFQIISNILIKLFSFNGKLAVFLTKWMKKFFLNFSFYKKS